MNVLVLPHAKVPGWPGPHPPGRCEALPLADALDRPWSTDAHFTAYAPFEPAPFRTNQALFDHEWRGALPVRMQLAVFDLDDPTAHASGEPASSEWRARTEAAITALTSQTPLVWWHTRGGSRLLGRLREPLELWDMRDAGAWACHYAMWLLWLRERGIEADPACADFGRLYRLPHATRQPGADPDWYGPVRGVELLTQGAAAWDPIDPATGVRLIEQVPRRALGRAPVRRSAPADGTPPSALVELLRQRGWLGREIVADSKWACYCPSGLEHGLKTDTVVWADGTFHCSHRRCAELDPWAGWTEAELRSAIRTVTGVTPR